MGIRLRPCADDRAADAYTKVKNENAQLRRTNRELTEQFEFAFAAIQRRGIENEALRADLHAARGVVRLPRPRRSDTPTVSAPVDTMEP